MDQPADVISEPEEGRLVDAQVSGMTGNARRPVEDGQELSGPVRVKRVRRVWPLTLVGLVEPASIEQADDPIKRYAIGHDAEPVGRRVVHTEPVGRHQVRVLVTDPTNGRSLAEEDPRAVAQLVLAQKMGLVRAI